MSAARRRVERGGFEMDLAQARDLAIVFLAIEALIVTLLLGVVAALLWRLVSMIQREIKPVLASMQQTANTVRGTTEFVSDNLVSPMIKVSSFASGVMGAIKAMMVQLRRKEG
jgi:hypothetical protein